MTVPSEANGEVPNWHEIDITTLKRGAEIGGFESPAEWDDFSILAATQMLAAFHTGDVQNQGRYQNNRAVYAVRSPQAGKAITRMFEQPVIAEAYQPEDVRLICANAAPLGPERARFYRRPESLSEPVVRKITFLGATMLRSRFTDELVGSAGVSFRLEFDRAMKSGDVMVTRWTNGDLALGKTASDIHPNLIRFD